MTPVARSFLQDDDFIAVLYIIAFALFIYGLMGLTGPKTAVRGNRIAGVGMAVALIATFLIPGIGNWGLIVLGIVIGRPGRISWSLPKAMFEPQNETEPMIAEKRLKIATYVASPE